MASAASLAAVLPPTSMWWALVAANPMSRPSAYIGIAMITSFAWVAPWYGWLAMKTSPASMPPSPNLRSRCAITDDMTPSCAGRFSAWLTSSPRGPKIAHE